MKMKMNELCASRASDEAGGSTVTGHVSVEEQMTVIESELGGKPGTRVRGIFFLWFIFYMLSCVVF